MTKGRGGHPFRFLYKSYFFIYVNRNSSCLLYHLFHVLMSIKNLQMVLLSIIAYIIWPPEIEGHDVTRNRPSPRLFTRKLPILCQNVELPSVILQNTCQYFCIKPLSIFAEHLSLILQNTS